MSEPDVAIVSGCTRLRYASFVGHQMYSRRHRLSYHLELTPFEGVSGYWHKVAALDAHIREHDWVVWFDDDAFITDLESTFVLDAIRVAEGSAAWLVVAPSPADELNGAWAAYNTGVFALRNCEDSYALLSVMADAPMHEIQSWWDVDRLGMFTGGDQDALVWFMETGGHQGSIHWVDPMKWNARPWHYVDGLADATVCHFPGQPDKTLAITQFARSMGTDESLVRPRGQTQARGGIHAQVPIASVAGARLRSLSISSQRLAGRVRRKISWFCETGRWS